MYILLHLIKFYQVLASICMQEHYHKNEIVWPHGEGLADHPLSHFSSIDAKIQEAHYGVISSVQLKLVQSK